MSTTDDTNAARRGPGSNNLLGQASEAVPLVERLREMSRRGYWPLLGDEAADEIERLSADVAKLQEPVEDLAAWRLRFAGAVAAIETAERERCAKVCESVASDLESAEEDAQAMSTGAQSCADQIRAGA